jgi:hypothetical protein
LALPGQLVVQVGLGQQDHKFWRRPEDIKERRPAAICNSTAPGADVAAAMAAALAATALVFRDFNPGYAGQSLAAAENLYRWAQLMEQCWLLLLMKFFN